jgi:putative membrane protein
VTLDALLAIAHHLSVFSLVALLVVELVVMRPPMAAPEIARFSRYDGLYGIAAIAVIIVGIARINLGAIPADFYMHNAFFWLKMTALGVIAILTIHPTVRAGAWRKAVAADPAYAVPEDEVRRVRRTIHIELAILPLVPISAALMARGIGAF